ncbi:MAG: hypothetical protein DRO87_11205 [Candidatus Thorarchaeota archaeon]|nr:MAG: hypothetical protein DRO87_11205 [Candidatus Thorarchaeota archaeon]
MATRFLISDGSKAKAVQAYKIVDGGIVKPVIKAAVAQDGKVRHYWPVTADPGGGTEPTRIAWDGNPFTVRMTAALGDTAVALASFDRNNGICYYNNFPSADGRVWFLRPPLDGTPTDNGKFIIRAVQSSGDAVTGVLNTWIDLNAAATVEWSLDRAALGVGLAGLTVTIAEDAGGGTPVNEVTRTINFRSDVVEVSKISWTTYPRVLEEIKESEDADCSLLFNPSLFATGDADSGSFTEAWAWPGENPADYTVLVQVVAGVNPIGSPLNTKLSLDALREWVLRATTGEDLRSDMNVTVEDSSLNTVVKRVTMHSQRTSLPPDPIWTTTNWVISDQLANVPGGEVSEAQVSMLADGTALGTSLYDANTQEMEDWHPDKASLPEGLINYEAMMNTTFDPDGVEGSPVGEWINMASGLVYWKRGFISGVLEFHTWTVSVRKVGGIQTDKQIALIMGYEEGGISP